MTSFDLISLSLRNLLRRKTRTLLAVIGVVVGTCAIIVMVSIGFGLSVSSQAQIESFGNLHLIDVYSGGGGVYYGNGGGMAVSSSDSTTEGKLNDKAIKTISEIQGVTAASPKVEAYLSFGIGKYVMRSQVVGITPEIFQLFNYELQDGRLLLPGDKFDVLFGNQTPTWFYNPKKAQSFSWGAPPPVNVLTDKLIVTADERYMEKPIQGQGGVDGAEEVKYKEYKAKGVGILANPDDQSSYTVYMPITTLAKINEEALKARKQPIDKNRGYDSAMVYVDDLNEMDKVTEAIRSMGFQTNSLSDWLNQAKQQAKLIQGILGGIGAISLFVAALGITNTMIMSIYERTKEIGVMKVIGANLPDIKKMFLIEAGLIGLVGGVVGMTFSFIISLIMNTFLAGILNAMMGGMGGEGSVISIIPWWVALGAIAFSTVIGIISGYYPAKRAMKLSALESLKNE